MNTSKDLSFYRFGLHSLFIFGAVAITVFGLIMTVISLFPVWDVFTRLGCVSLWFLWIGAFGRVLAKEAWTEVNATRRVLRDLSTRWTARPSDES
jgi:hypothetical protein